MAYRQVELEPGAERHLDRDGCDVIAMTATVDHIRVLIESDTDVAIVIRSEQGIVDVIPARDGTYVDQLTRTVYTVSDDGTRCEPFAR